ncbi:MAG: nucleoside hydrolase [Oscillospiraceae bacterium]
MSKIPVIFNVDTGIDDAMAMTLAFSSNKLDVLGVCTLAGNTSLHNTNKNTLDVISFLGRNVPVAKGADRPMMYEGVYTNFAPVHGKNGLANVTLPESTLKNIDISAVEFMKQTLEKSTEKITIVSVGPLTNIATLILAHQHLLKKIEKIVIMGGATLSGNVKPTAEFNVNTDPEAAHIFFNSGVPIVMAGLDVTHKAYILKNELDEISKIDTKAGELFGKIVPFYYEQYMALKVLPGCPIHDVVTIAYLIDPDIFETKYLHVKVDINGALTKGCTVTDFKDVTKKKPNTEVILDVDREKFISLIKKSFKNFK